MAMVPCRLLDVHCYQSCSARMRGAFSSCSSVVSVGDQTWWMRFAFHLDACQEGDVGGAVPSSLADILRTVPSSPSPSRLRRWTSISLSCTLDCLHTSSHPLIPSSMSPASSRVICDESAPLQTAATRALITDPFQLHRVNSCKPSGACTSQAILSRSMDTSRDHRFVWDAITAPPVP